jgi:hypothetical protein
MKAIIARRFNAITNANVIYLVNTTDSYPCRLTQRNHRYVNEGKNDT